MLGEIGPILLGLSLATALYAVFAAFWGARHTDSTLDARWVRSARNASFATAILLGGALFVLLIAFLSDQFAIRYVGRHSSSSLPLYLKVSALWAGQEGSLLLWSAMQAGFTALAVIHPSRQARHLAPWATFFLNLITAFFILATLISTPFAELIPAPHEGQGLNPLLRHPGMIFHPPTLYIGYVGLAVPFAFAMAALVTHNVRGWTRAAHPWILGAWLGLGGGILLGMRWAYDVLGWGGYWGWDPVENAGLLPWLTTTALLHGAVMQEERRGFQIWNFMLVIISFVLVLFGTFATRSGFIQSVHAYAQSELGNYFLVGIGVSLISALGLLLHWARSRSTLEQGSMPSQEDDRLLSRNGMFFLTLLLLCTLTASVFVGTLLPTVTKQLLKQRLSAGPAWFDRVTGPQFAALVLVMGVCPLLGHTVRAYQRHRTETAASHLQSNLYWLWIGGIGIAISLFLALTSLDIIKPLPLLGIAITGFTGTLVIVKYAEGITSYHHRIQNTPLNILDLLQTLGHLLRTQRRKYGGYLVHLGVTLMAIGVIGTRMISFEREIALNQGKPTVVGDYTLVFEELQREINREGTSVGDLTQPEETLAHGQISSVSTWAAVSVYRRTPAISNGAYLTTLAPGLIRYINPHTNLPLGQSVSIPALLPRVREDLYMTLTGWTEDQSTVALKIVINKLVNFLWLGGLMLLAGGALALWPTHLPRIWNTILLLLGLSLIIGASWAMWGTSQSFSPEEQGGRPLVGQMAPDFTLTLLDGTRFSLADAQGQVIVLNFWASWCPPCKDELPALQAVWEAYQPNEASSNADKHNNVRFIGIAYQEKRDNVADTMETFGITYPIGLDPQEHVAERYGITGIPETFIIAPDGRIAYVHIGPITADTLREQIQSCSKPMN